MEIEIANDVVIMNLKSLTGVKDGIMDGDIPNWLLVELLIRLPQKVVFRFKLVSKQWLSIILDPSFIKFYCSRALSMQKLQPWTFISSIGHFDGYEGTHGPDCELLVDIYSRNLKWPSLYALSLPCFPHPHENGYMIYEVSNGFVLHSAVVSTEWSFRDTANCRICNPVTGQWIALPSHGSRQNCVNWGFVTNVEDGVLMHYSVVRLYVSGGKQSKFLTCEVFLSEVGEWKKYTMPIDFVIKAVFRNSSAVVNGVMHWTLGDHGLIAYDPHKRPDRVRIIVLPREQMVNRFFHICAAYQGQLRYLRVSTISENLNTFQCFNIWVLNDYNSGVWCLQHRVNYEDIQISTALSAQNLFLILPISFHPYDSDIVYLVYEKMILSYNIKSRKLEVPEDIKLVWGKETFKWWMTHLLPIPPWPVSFSRPLLELQRIN